MLNSGVKARKCGLVCRALLGAFVLFEVGCGTGSQKSNTQQSTVNKDADSGNKGAGTATAEEISRESASDPNAANKKYREKKTTFEGVIGKPPEKSSLNGAPYLLLRGSEADSVDLVCDFEPEAEKKVLALKWGQKVKVRGRFAHELGVGAGVSFVNCELIELLPEPNVSAEQLAQEYTANRSEADKKYKNRRLLVRGMVIEVPKKAIADLIIAGAKDGEGMPINIEITFEQGASFQNLKKDDKVLISGRCQGRLRKNDPVVLSDATMSK